MKRLGWVCVLVLSGQVQAAGFRLAESSTEGVALGNAMVANTTLSGAFPYNYALAGFHEGTTISADLLLYQINQTVTPHAPNARRDTISNETDAEILPSLYATHRLNQQWALGMHVGVPFGLSSQWPADTFSHFSQVDAAVGAAGAIAGLHPTDSRLELVNISPSVAFRPIDALSLSAGLDYYRVRDVELNAVGSRTWGSGEDFGWHLGAVYQADSWALGAHYHAPTTIDIDGNTDIVGVGRSTGKTALNLPPRFQVGVNYRFHPRWSAELDIEHIGWSRYDTIRLTATGGALPAGTVLSENANHWQDVMNIRLGVTWQWSDNTTVMFGAGYEQTPQPKKFFDATIADSDRYTVSLGVNQHFADGWQIKAGYLYGWQTNRSMNGRSYAEQVATSGGSHTDPNGSDVYNGRYEGDGHVFSLGISKRF